MSSRTTSASPSSDLFRVKEARCASTSIARGLRVPAALGVAAALVLVPAAAASAHVRVSADSTAAGGYAQLTFRVPTESETASTTSVRVDLPTDTPFTSVSTRPIPGWTAVVEEGPLPEPVEVAGTTITEAPTAVVWTADADSAVAPGQYQEFAISAGPLPDEGTELVLPTTQTYSDGEVASWSEPTPASGEEPESPAPTVLVTAAGEEHSHGADDEHAADEAAEADTVAMSAGSGSGSGSDDTTARWLGGGGLALGAAALVVALVRGRRPAGVQA